jgi:hypothetical protein
MTNKFRSQPIRFRKRRLYLVSRNTHVKLFLTFLSSDFKSDKVRKCQNNSEKSQNQNHLNIFLVKDYCLYNYI